MIGYGGYGWMIFGMIFLFLIIGGIIALVIWLAVRWGRQSSGASPSARQDPVDIAKERYARGEITREQFEQIKKDLTGP